MQGAVIDRPGVGRKPSQMTDAGTRSGQDGEETIEVMAGHLPEDGLFKAGQVARLDDAAWR